MKVTQICSGQPFTIEKTVEDVLFGEFVFIVAFLSDLFVDRIEML